MLRGEEGGINIVSEKESEYEWLCHQCSHVIAGLEINNFSVYIRDDLIDRDNIKEGIKY